MDFGPDRWRLYRLSLREAGRATRESMVWSLSRLSGAPVPTRLLFAPQDLRTGDPTVAQDIYAGYFVFAGRAVQAGGRRSNLRGTGTSGVARASRGARPSGVRVDQCSGV